MHTASMPRSCRSSAMPVWSNVPSGRRTGAECNISHISSTSTVLAVSLSCHDDRPAAERLPDVLEPGIHRVRRRWIRGFTAFQLARPLRTVVLMVPACPESGWLGRAARPRPAS